MPAAMCFEQFDATYQPKAGRALVVGSKVYKTREDRRKRYANVVGVDMLPGEGVDHVVDLEVADEAGDLLHRYGQFSHVDCLSVLEHSKRPWLLAYNIERLMEPGGTLRVTAPFVWRIHGYPGDFFRFTPAGVAALFGGIKWDWLGFAHLELSQERNIPQVLHDGLPHFARTETYGFGRRV